MDAYLNFELSVSRDEAIGYVLEVTESPIGETAIAATTVDAQELERRLRGIAGPGGQGSTDRGLHFVNTKGGSTQSVESVGQELFDALMVSEVSDLYRKSLYAAQEKGKGLRVRLRIEAPDLATLPWEYLFDESDGDFIALSKRTPVTRYLEVARPPPKPTREPRIRILGMVVSPKDLPPLDVEREKSQIEEALAGRLREGEVALEWLDGQTWRDLQRAMRKEHWNVFHFIGHGDFQNDEGVLAMADEDGNSQLMTATQVGRLLADHDSLRLAVLNSCRGASASNNDLYSSTGAVLMRRGVPAVVSMQYEISDRAAIEFARMFYEVLADNEPVDTAVTEARIAISNVPGTRREWATPVLHMRTADGVLFVPNVADEIFAGLPGAQIPAPTPPRPAAAPPGANVTKGLGILAAKVKSSWIDGVLGQSIHRAALIDLGLETMQSAVDDPWGGLIEQAGEPSRGVPEGQSLGQIFDEMGGSLLILGEPGSGKTITLLQLARELLARSEDNPGHAVPVVFNLSSWAATGFEFGRWLEDEMAAKYQIPSKVGSVWLANKLVTPLLDGLDEVPAASRSACVEEINAFNNRAAMPILVCSRLKEYLDLRVRLSLSAAIRLQRLTSERVFDYVRRGGDRLAALALAMQQEPALLIEARTPLMLAMMVRSYQDASPEEIRTQGIEHLETRRRQLMEDYVFQRFSAARRQANDA